MPGLRHHGDDDAPHHCRTDPVGDNRRWKPLFVAGGVMLQSKLSGLCMHIATYDGLVLRQHPCDATSPGQVFVLTPRQDG